MNKFEKNAKSSQSSYVHFDHHFDVFDKLLKLKWYIYIIRIFIQCILFFLFTQPEVTVTRLLLIATHINEKASIMFKDKKRKAM